MVSWLGLLASILCRKCKYHIAPAFQLGGWYSLDLGRELSSTSSLIQTRTLNYTSLALHLSSVKQTILSGFYNAVCIFGF